MAGNLPSVVSLVHDPIRILTLSDTLNVIALVLSMTVNAVTTGLIVFRIFKVFREVKTGTDDQVLRIAGRNTPLRRAMFVIIESGSTLFFN